MDDIESFDDDIDSSRGELDELDKILEEFLYDDPIESLTAEQKAFAIINEILNEKSSNSQHKATKPHEELNVSEKRAQYFVASQPVYSSSHLWCAPALA